MKKKKKTLFFKGRGCPERATPGFLPEKKARVRGSPAQHRQVYKWHLVSVKSGMSAKPSKFPFKLYQSGGAISSVADQNCDAMSPDQL